MHVSLMLTRSLTSTRKLPAEVVVPKIGAPGGLNFGVVLGLRDLKECGLFSSLRCLQFLELRLA